MFNNDFSFNRGDNLWNVFEETLAFYPIFMPIFLKSGIDGMLGTMSKIAGSLIGTIFSIVNAFPVVIVSYSAWINFTDGIVLRVVGLVFGDLLICGFFYFYYAIK